MCYARAPEARKRDRTTSDSGSARAASAKRSLFRADPSARCGSKRAGARREEHFEALRRLEAKGFHHAEGGPPRSEDADRAMRSDENVVQVE